MQSDAPSAAGAETVEKRLDTEGRLKGQSTGGEAEQTSNIARGTPENLADLRLAAPKPKGEG
ncbi:MAG TPA: hypothetical protein VK522_18530, partial [Pseudolabrys sp.]|nr:hypothetical protein [Pseudolabrys sp.]